MKTRNVRQRQRKRYIMWCRGRGFLPPPSVDDGYFCRFLRAIERDVDQITPEENRRTLAEITAAAIAELEEEGVPEESYQHLREIYANLVSTSPSPDTLPEGPPSVDADPPGSDTGSR